MSWKQKQKIHCKDNFEERLVKIKITHTVANSACNRYNQYSISDLDVLLLRIFQRISQRVNVQSAFSFTPDCTKEINELL